MKSKKGKYKSFLCALLCSLLFCACEQGAELSQEDTVKLSETKKEESEESIAVPEGAAAIPGFSGAENADEILALLIEDKGFRKQVRYAAGIEEEDSPEEIMQKLEDCESIVLDEAPYGTPIFSLKSLSLLPNLKQLVIIINQGNDSQIGDFTPIAQLSQLEYFYICYEKDEQIDLSFLGGMHTIRELFLVQCKIEDFSFLGQMPQLQCLSLYGTFVEDLAVLEKLPELVELALAGNVNAAHIEAVGTLTKMQDLGMQYCGIEDISFLSGLTELRGVNLNGNSVTDITPLAGLDKLEQLGLAENGIKDISVLEGLPNLFNLSLDKNEIGDISPLTSLSHLNQLGLSDNQIEDLSPLAGKEELMYAAVSGNPMKSIEPVWEVPVLLYTDRGVSEEEEVFIAAWLGEHYSEAEEFACIDFIQGDLNSDGLQDIAFVVDSDAFCGYHTSNERRMFILLQQKDGSWMEQEDTPYLGDATSGGMRGDPYIGAFIQDGYLMVKVGWGSSSGTVQTDIYEYHNENLSLIKQVNVDDYNYAEGYDVKIRNEQTGAWQRYAIAMDGSLMVRVDLEDSEHMAHKAFPRISLFDSSYYIYHDKIKSGITSEEALDRVCEEVVVDGDSAVREKLPYVEWQKDGYELLLGVTLPDYYYALSESESKGEAGAAEWNDDYYLFYNGMIIEDERLYHVICMVQDEKIRKFLLDDATGEISEE